MGADLTIRAFFVRRAPTVYARIFRPARRRRSEESEIAIGRKNPVLARSGRWWGNLFLNRAITGAIVERHPFGGYKMSGGGTKAGGPGYLENLLFPRVIVENVMRRGFRSTENLITMLYFTAGKLDLPVTH